MNRRVLPVLLPAMVLLAWSASAGAQQSGLPYIDPALKRLLAPETRQAVGVAGRFDLLSADAPLPLQRQLAVDRDARGRPRVGAFLDLSDPGALGILRAHGVDVGTVVRRADGHVLVTARIPLDLADSVMRAPGLAAIYAAARVKVSNDSGVHAIHADEVRQLTGSTWVGSAGQGVIVGIYDTGLDFTHGDFLTGTGATRLIGAWDQTVTGTPPGMGFTYGNFCSVASIQNAIAGNGGCSLIDSNGHGTHVAGTAAGNGAAAGTGTQYQYAGVAPAADIVSVKGGNGSFTFDQIVDGIAFVDSLSLRQQKPAVVNLSLGGQGGAHDGTTLPEQMIDALARPGFAVVVAAGNDGSNGTSITPFTAFLFHATNSIATGEVRTASITIAQYSPNVGACQNFEAIDVWYAGADALDVAVVRPNGLVVTAAAGGTINDDAASGYVQIDNASGGPDPENHDNYASVVISDCGPSRARPAQGTWRLQLTGHSVISGKPFHIWLAQGDLGGTEASGATGFDNRYIVGVPGTAKSVITVGAFTTKQSWVSTDGRSHFYTDRTPLGELADFSSAGPTRDEREKPEIAAPGAAVVSALSKNASHASSLAVAADGKHWALEGTSMATPHVTGAVALMFQARPDLTSAQLRQIFQSTASQDAFTAKTYGGGVPQNWWGGGKLNIKTALAALNVNPSIVASVVLSVHVDTLPRNATDRLSATVYGALGTKLDSAVVWSSSNAAVATVDATGLVRAVAAGNAFVVASAGGKRDSAAIVVVAPSTLVMNGRAIAPTQATSSRNGTMLPLLSLSLVSHGYEGMRVRALAFDVKGVDPAAQVVLVRDVDRSGTIGPNDIGIATLAVPLASASQAQRVTFSLDSLVVPANDSTTIIVAIQLSGQIGNGTGFTASLVREATHTLGIRSQAVDQLDTTATAPVAAAAITTVLSAGEVFAMSENPVRNNHVVFNFSTRPAVAAVYSLSGRRVANLLRQMTSDARVDWALVNDDGKPVANGIYLVVFDVGVQMIRHKIFVARPQE